MIWRSTCFFIGLVTEKAKNDTDIDSNRRYTFNGVRHS